MSRKLVPILLTVAFAFGLCPSAQAQDCDWSIDDLGTLPGGHFSAAHGLNTAGWVVGAATFGAGGGLHAFLYDGTMRDLGTLPGGTFSEALGINDAGWVIGDGSVPGTPAPSHAFLYDGTLNDLGALPDGTFSLAQGINAAGWVVGWGNTSDGLIHAFLYDGTTMRDLNDDFGSPAGGAEAIAINAAGLVVGLAGFAGAAGVHAFLYDGTMHDLGTLPGGSTSVATGINDAGWVVGWSTVSGGLHHAFLYDGTMRDLGGLPGTECEAAGINAGGLVVGYCYDDFSLSAVFYTDLGMFDLSALTAVQAAGWHLQWAAAINDAGQIVGQGIIAGEMHAFRLTPPAAPDQCTGP